VSDAGDQSETLYAVLDLDDEAGLLVDSLSPAEAKRLADLLSEARTAEAAEVDAGVDAMVAAIPSVVRGRVRKVLQRDGS
jgi:hypothetical protein